MEESRRQVITYPTLEQIVFINRTLVDKSGGHFSPPLNLKEQGALEWVLDAIQHPLFGGFDPYPTLIDKTAILTWKIIAGHLFWDGNKRLAWRRGSLYLRTMVLRSQRPTQRSKKSPC